MITLNMFNHFMFFISYDLNISGFGWKRV